MAHVEPPPISVTVVFAPAPHQVEAETLLLPAGATVEVACAASALLRRCLGAAKLGGDGGSGGATLAPGAANGLRLGLWGRLCQPGTVLQDQDRLELLRPLALDPMEARRQRLRRDGRHSPRRLNRPARGA